MEARTLSQHVGGTGALSQRGLREDPAEGGQCLKECAVGRGAGEVKRVGEVVDVVAAAVEEDDGMGVRRRGLDDSDGEVHAGGLGHGVDVGNEFDV